jgi:hypothetical protein
VAEVEEPLLQSQYEPGIEPVFWQNADTNQQDKVPVILSMVRPG